MAALLKKRWKGLRHLLAGAAIVALGIGASIAIRNAFGAVALSLALLLAAYFTLKGIIETIAKP